MTKLNDLDFNDVSNVLEYWNMREFVDFVKEKQINGRTLQDVSEGMVELWCPTADAEKLILFLKDIQKDPWKYLKCLDRCMNYDIIKVKETNLCSESQYQTVSVRKISQQENTDNKTVEEILKKITVPKSFLYRHAKRQEKSLTSYVPMDAGTENKPKKFFRLSSYDYPIFDLKIQFPKVENFSDRGYYFIKPSNKSCSQKTCNNTSAKSKYKSLMSPEELEDKVPEEHFYEDLCYNDINVENKERKDETRETRVVKPCVVKIHELFQSFKLPFFKKSVVSGEKNEENIRINNKEREGNIYENSSVDMYDCVHVARDSGDEENTKQHTTLAVEDYLDPVQLNKDYCDVAMKEKDESFLNYILNYFESRLRSRRVGVPLVYNLSVRVTDGVLDVFYGIFHCLTDVVTETNDTTHSEESEAEPSCEQWERKIDMAARPLPVPVENEPFYMNVDRTDAENLLMGQPDGTFILRPSSQPSHAYTLTVSCANSVHNVGVRRRPDGRLALGFARKGERSFTSVTSLLRHHKKRRLLLVAGGGVIGGTTLNETPQYYQVPRNIPVL